MDPNPWLMMLASVVVLTKARPQGDAHFFGLLGLCGVSTFVMGGITGGFLGDFHSPDTEGFQSREHLCLPCQPSLRRWRTR